MKRGPLTSELPRLWQRTQTFLEFGGFGGFLVVFLVAIITHISYIGNSLTWLDHGDIELGKALIPGDALVTAFERPFGETSFYRPVMTILHSLDYYVYGGIVSGYHLTNIVLHALAAVGAVAFARTYFSLSRKNAIWVGIVFAVHPLSWLIAGSISYRTEAALILSLFLGWWGYYQTRTKKQIAYLLIYGIGFFLALLTKETALFWLPALIVWWEIWRHWKKKKQKLGYARQLGALGLLILVGYVLLREMVVPEMWTVSAWNLNWDEQIGTRMYLLGRMVGWLVVPTIPSLADMVKKAGAETIWFWLAPMLVACLIFIWVKQRRLMYIVGFLIIAILPGMQIVPTPRFSSPHYAYLAVVTMGVLGVYVVNRLGKSRWNRFTAPCIGLWLIASSFTTIAGGDRFYNDLTLFGPEIERNPQYFEGRFWMGWTQMQRGYFSAAAEEFESALSIPEDNIGFRNEQTVRENLALSYVGMGKVQAASSIQKEYQIVLAEADLLAVAQILWEQQQFDTALQILETTEWKGSEAYLLAAKIYIYQREKEKAIVSLTNARNRAEGKAVSAIQALIDQLKTEGIVN